MKIALLIFAYILYMLSAPFICKLAIMLQYRPYREDLGFGTFNPSLKFNCREVEI